MRLPRDNQPNPSALHYTIIPLASITVLIVYLDGLLQQSPSTSTTRFLQASMWRYRGETRLMIAGASMKVGVRSVCMGLMKIRCAYEAFVER